MSKILLIVTSVLVLAAAALGFLTRNKVIGLKDELTSREETIKQKDTQLAKAATDLKASQEETAANKTKLDQAEADLATSQKNLESAKGELAAAQQTVESNKAEITRLTNQIAAAGGTPTTTGGESPDADALRKQLTDAQNQAAEARQVSDSLTAKVSELQSQNATLKEKAERRDRQVVAKGLEGQVLAVNRAWNFVVLSIGDRQGVVQNAEMVVVRDGAMVGKVKITSVEPSTSIADVVPGSMPKGASVRPGDRVIYQGS